MRITCRIAGAFLGALAISVISPRLASSQEADTQEVLRYKLTDAGLAKYIQATKNLIALPGKPGACDEADPELQSLDDMAANLEAAPGAAAALQSAGMTPREYVVFSMSLLQNGMAVWAASQPGGAVPAGVSQANVDFIKTHNAQLAELELLKPQDGCDEEPAEEQSEE